MRASRVTTGIAVGVAGAEALRASGADWVHAPTNTANATPTIATARTPVNSTLETSEGECLRSLHDMAR
jgi:hypothetical protein